jgi:hypothetical protein
MVKTSAGGIWLSMKLGRRLNAPAQVAAVDAGPVAVAEDMAADVARVVEAADAVVEAAGAAVAVDAVVIAEIAATAGNLAFHFIGQHVSLAGTAKSASSVIGGFALVLSLPTSLTDRKFPRGFLQAGNFPPVTCLEQYAEKMLATADFGVLSPQPDVTPM